MSWDVACLQPTDDFEYTTIMEDIVQGYGIDATFQTYRIDESHHPQHNEFDAVVVTGSAAHVYDEQDWVLHAAGFLQDMLREDVPVLGVCYGHQLLAYALGGEVTSMPEREMGYQEISLTEEGQDHRLFDGFDDPFVAFTSHQDTVKELPSGCTSLAENEYGNHAFAVDNAPGYGVQFHPEYSRAMAEELIGQKDLSRDAETEIRATVTDETATANERARRVFRNVFQQL